MIQRIQTVYLLLATALMSLTLFLPLATIWQGGNEIIIKAWFVDGTVGFNAPLPLYLVILLSLTTILPLITIFLYKKRMVQIRFCVSEIVLLLGSAAFIALYCYRMCDVLAELMQDINFTLGFAALMPIVAIIPVVLAIRGIAKDEALVRSLDRIR
ncbi:MAG: DUF4293 domain-containing protein [Alistipes sp.]|nr:DUF4293 domain-containing protein [Alistipes sp.]